MRKIVLLDGNSIMFRAYYATAYTGNLMKTSNGLYTNAVYGFVNMMNSILSIDGLTHIFVAFDKGKKLSDTKLMLIIKVEENQCLKNLLCKYHI